MWKNVWKIIKVELPIFAVVVAINGLTGGSILNLIKSLGLTIEKAILVFFTAPVGIYILFVLISRLSLWILKSGRNLYFGWRTKVLYSSSLSDTIVIASIRQAEKRGVISENEAQNMERIASSLEPECLYILILLDDPVSWAKSRGVQFPPWEKVKRYELLKFGVPLFRKKIDWKPYVERLYEQGLLTLPPKKFEASVPKSKLLSPVTSKMGHDLVYVIEKYHPHS